MSRLRLMVTPSRQLPASHAAVAIDVTRFAMPLMLMPLPMILMLMLMMPLIRHACHAATLPHAAD